MSNSCSEGTYYLMTVCSFCLILPDVGNTFAHCSLCSIDFGVYHGGRSDVTQHVRSEHHIKSDKAAPTSKSLTWSVSSGLIIITINDYAMVVGVIKSGCGQMARFPFSKTWQLWGGLVHSVTDAAVRTFSIKSALCWCWIYMYHVWLKLTIQVYSYIHECDARMHVHVCV